MGFKYPCFISYCHGQKDLISRFISEFKDNLNSSLEPYFDEEVFVDSDRLIPGYKYNIALSKAICQSLCMIVVYIPRYEQHEYCRKEFAAMESLEETRFGLMQEVNNNQYGMIIPVILRGDKKKLPKKIVKSIHYADFSQYTTASNKLGKDKDGVKKIEKIAHYIYDLSETIDDYSDRIFSNCDAFRLPENVPMWRDKIIKQQFPGKWENRKRL